MRNIQRAAALLLICTVLAVAGCSTGSGYRESRPTVDCDQMGDEVIYRMRSGETSGSFGELMDQLIAVCPSESEIATGYAANSTIVLGMPSCDMLAETTRIEAVKMLYQDGLCENVPAPSSWPNSGLGWDSAREHAGTYQRVCGPLKSLRNTHDGAFANVGLDYPDVGRFAFIMWGVHVDPITPGTTVCASGNIYLYEGGVAQMELGAPTELEIWD